MKLRLNRFKKSEKSWIGRLFVDGQEECYILERLDMIIPVGEYELELYNSPKHGVDTLQLRGVKGRSNIQIHIANAPHELLGCLAPGKSYKEDWVSQSKVATDALRAKVVPLLEDGERVTIMIHED